MHIEPGLCPSIVDIVFVMADKKAMSDIVVAMAVHLPEDQPVLSFKVLI